MSTPSALFRTVPSDQLHFWKGAQLDYGKVREFVGLDTRDISKMARVAKSSVRYDNKAPAEVREHLANIANLCNLVFEFFQDDVKTKLWLQTPNPMLGNSAPLDMLRAGRYPKLIKFVMQAIEDGDQGAAASKEQAKTA